VNDAPFNRLTPSPIWLNFEACLSQIQPINLGVRCLMMEVEAFLEMLKMKREQMSVGGDDVYV
jgi:hypothetical protein